ncbi:MAG: [protein-PII] uridylyltransferase [Acidobacteriota bacterium]
MAFKRENARMFLPVERQTQTEAPAISGESASESRSASGLSLLEYGRRLHRADMQRLKMKHRSGMSGGEVVAARSQLIDFLVRGIYSEIFEPNGEPGQLALVALGGYGRQELAPHSDVDLMILVKSRPAGEQVHRIQKMLCLLWDMGFQVGHSVRTVKDAVQIARADLVSQMSMLDARAVCGNEALFAAFQARMERFVRQERDSLADRLALSIEERHRGQGGTAFIQEPDVKEAKGGLRDFHSILWFCRILFPGAKVEEALETSRIDSGEWQKAQEAYEFLLRLRNELHFQAGRGTNVLSHAKLNDIARYWGLRGNRFQKDSEELLKQYFRQVRRISHVLDPFLTREKNTWGGLRWSSIRLPVRRKNTGLGKPTTVVKDVPATPTQWMQLFRYTQVQPSLFERASRSAIRQKFRSFSRESLATSALGADFRAILRKKGQVAPSLRQMHELGFLGRVVPEFGRLTGMVQQDRYHKYTTDEHTLRAIEILDQVALGTDPAHEGYQRVMNEIHDSSTLYFAVLLHDAGKGLGGGHSVRGAHLAAQALERLSFDPDEAAKVETLVRHHLLMGHVSQRRKLDDPHTVAEFVKCIDRPDTLNLLLLLTYADACAVGPGVWTEWKDAQLWELYHRAYDQLMFGEDGEAAIRSEADRIQHEVAERLKEEVELSAVVEHFRMLPERYALYTSVDQIAAHIRLARRLDKVAAAFEWVERPGKGYADLLVVTRDRPGLFAMIAGALSAFNLNILSAQLNTRRDGLVLDQFQIGGRGHRLEDADYSRVERLLKRVLDGEIDIAQYLRTHLKRGSLRNEGPSVAPRIRIDNNVSPSATVLEVQAEDRLGLGYRIARTLAQIEVEILFAKLATEKSHAFDVFYVQERKGGKIQSEDRRTKIVEQLHADLVGSVD